MTLQRIAAFSDGNIGGNPAGVMIGESMPGVQEMQRIAAEVGYSETAFAAPEGDEWRVRYFSPESEVPFCGHATIALGAALGMKEGEGIFCLKLNEADITVEGRSGVNGFSASLQSPPTKSAKVDPQYLQAALNLFGYGQSDVNLDIPPAIINGGAKHLLIVLKDRGRLADMDYDLDAGRKLMAEAGLVTISLVVAESAQKFHARNAFASGGVLEDPATGAAAAALAGYLRDIGWPHGGEISIVQGEDMGARSLIRAEIGPQKGSSIRVSGTTREIT